jgi:transcriptional regulator with XRE-family HTH domain
LACNIKDRRKKLGMSQERLAELTDLSIQTIHFIEECRTWVSDKTLVRLADALGLEAFQLIIPVFDGKGKNRDPLRSQLLSTLKRDITDFIDKRFDTFADSEPPA